MTTTSKNTKMTKTVTLGEGWSRGYGHPKPQIRIRFPKGTSEREVSAALYRLAAEIELATAEKESWRIEMDRWRARGVPYGRVSLDLGLGPLQDNVWTAQRAEAMLKKLVG